MNEEKWRPGDRVKLYSQDETDAAIDAMERVETDSQRGWLVSFILDDGGPTQPYWYPDGGVMESEIDLRKRQSGMPLDCAYKSWNDFDWSLYREDVSIQKKIAEKFIEKFDDYSKQGRGLYIFSDTKGSGKTFLSCVLANEILKQRDISAKFVNIADYVELIKQKDDRSREMVQSYFDCSLLILDDIGIEGNKQDWIQSAIFRLVDRRYTDIKSTIFTSNYQMENLPGDDRVTSRICKVSVPLAIPCQSIRAELAKEETSEFLQSIME